MAIFGIGAMYDKDVTDVFVDNSVACIGWSYDDAPALHNMMASMKVGDIVYIKSHPPDLGLTIKAIGIVTDNKVMAIEGVGEACVEVEWIWSGKEYIGKLQDKNNVRNNTLYEEYYPDIQKKVIDLLLHQIRASSHDS